MESHEVQQSTCAQWVEWIEASRCGKEGEEDLNEVVLEGSRQSHNEVEGLVVAESKGSEAAIWDTWNNNRRKSDSKCRQNWKEADNLGNKAKVSTYEKNLC